MKGVLVVLFRFVASVWLGVEHRIEDKRDAWPNRQTSNPILAIIHCVSVLREIRGDTFVNRGRCSTHYAVRIGIGRVFRVQRIVGLTTSGTTTVFPSRTIIHLIERHIVKPLPWPNHFNQSHSQLTSID